MNKIIYDIELQPIQQNETTYNYYYEYVNQIKNKKNKIKFGLYCAKYCFEYNTEETKPLAQKCIDLIECWLIDSKLVTEQELIVSSYAVFNVNYETVCVYNAANAVYAAAYVAYSIVYNNYYDNLSWSLFYCSMIKNINMNLPHQYLQTLLRTTKQFNINNSYSNHIKQIISSDIDKLELVDYNMLLDISNEYYNIDLSEFNYENIFSRRNLIEMIRREYSNE